MRFIIFNLLGVCYVYTSLNPCKGLQLSNLLGPKLLIGSLEDKGNVIEAAILHDVTEALPADLTLAEWRVAVYVATQRTHGVVKVHTTQIVKTYNTIELLKGLVARLLSA